MAVLAALLSSGGAAAQQAGAGFEARAMGAFMEYCLPAVVAGTSAGQLAASAHLPEVNAAFERQLLAGRPGKVFQLPAVGSNVLLAAPDAPMCSIDIRVMKERALLAQLDYWFDTKHSPFRITQDKKGRAGEVERQYKGKVGAADVVVFASLRSAPVPGRIQAELTAGRVGGR